MSHKGQGIRIEAPTLVEQGSAFVNNLYSWIIPILYSTLDFILSI